MVTIKQIEPTRKALKKYVEYGIGLYKGNDYYVPPLISDEVDTLDPKKNPAFDHCQTAMWMAYDDGRPVGRITAIINRLANEKFGDKTMRFGFVDFIDDKEVADKLFAAAEEWGRGQGMTRAVGPMGFSDMDNEGMLTFGFDELATMAGVYNYPYYPLHMERMGWAKEVDYVEYQITVPEAIPEKFARVAAIVEKRLGLKVKRFASRRELKEQYGQAIFDLINEAYAGLYGYVPLTPKQIEHYIGMYLGILRLDTISVIVDKDDKLVCVGISMPSMSQALRKSGGKLFPFGWWHLLKGLKGDGADIVDLLLVAVKPEYQNKGVNALLFNDLIPSFQAHGFKYAESNVELEGNENVQKQWELFDRRLHKRRRIWQKNL